LRDVATACVILCCMGGEMSMWTDAVEPVGHRLAAIGEGLGEGWKGALPNIEVGEAAIGDDLMGNSFSAVYDADSQQIKAIAEQMPRDIRVDGGLAVECVRLYLAADGRARDALADSIADGA
jgi:hypothetical protein